MMPPTNAGRDRTSDSGIREVSSYGGFPKVGVPFWSTYNKDYGNLGSILGSPYCGKLPYGNDIPELRNLDGSKTLSC